MINVYSSNKLVLSQICIGSVIQVCTESLQIVVQVIVNMKFDNKLSFIFRSFIIINFVYWLFTFYSVRRTQVIDDESDYFAVDTNRWLSDHEREALRKRKEELHKQRHASRLDKKFTLDFAGRRVFEDDSDNVNMYDRNDAVVQAVNFGNPTSQQKGEGDGNPLINPTITQPAPKVRMHTF